MKKFYNHNKAARRKARVWKLKHITEEVASMSTENKYVEKMIYKISFVYCKLFHNINFTANIMNFLMSWKKIQK